MRWLARVAVGLGLLATFGAGAFMCQRVVDRGRFAVPYSTYGAGPRGARALFLLSEQLGVRPRRWTRDLAALPAGAMLVALGGCDHPPSRPLSRYEREELVRWVKGGGVVVVAGARGYLPERFGVRFGDEARCGADWRFSLVEARDATVPEHPDAGTRLVVDDPDDPLPRWADTVAPPLAGLGGVILSRPGGLLVDEGVAHRTLLRMGQQSAAVVVPHGEGHVVALASASLWQNEHIAASDGGPAFARLLDAYAPGGPVLFDEYHLGIGEQRSLMQYLRQLGAMPLFAQLALVVLLALWRGGARFGAPRLPEPAPVPGTASYVSATGALYARTGDAASALDVLKRRAVHDIARRHGLSGVDPSAVARELQQAGRAGASAAVETIRRASHEEHGLVGAARLIDDAVRSSEPRKNK